MTGTRYMEDEACLDKCPECGAEGDFDDECPSCGAELYDTDLDEYEYEREILEDEGPVDGVGFADPGGNSALRAATRDNPRDCPCPTCGRENVLTRIDRQRGYQCDRCADEAERGGY